MADEIVVELGRRGELAPLEPPISQSDTKLAQTVRAPDDARVRNGVEQLVGDDERQRVGGNRVERSTEGDPVSIAQRCRNEREAPVDPNVAWSHATRRGDRANERAIATSDVDDRNGLVLRVLGDLARQAA
ncbi:MAG: hypothetical protein HYU52_11685 [Acidobacteria bacterium]|nr:hypothetical protein [Acidobacteriota bacterium]